MHDVEAEETSPLPMKNGERGKELETRYVMLEIKNLHARIADDENGTEILKGINLVVPAGEVHAIMGPNGSGKSTLAYVLAGRADYEVTAGDILWKGESILDMSPDERAAKGVFLAFQYPMEIPGVATMTFLRAALNSVRKKRGQKEMTTPEFLKFVRAKAAELGVSDEMLKRPLNVGFSGGEKKRMEILQMAVLEPTLCVLDETDSGLDIDAIRIVSEGTTKLRSPDRAMLVITHYQRLLNYIVPDKVHVLANGVIQKTGGKELALELEKSGYAEFTGKAA
jgi:Fe-S cluster assembly ATP-binding protein